MIDSKEKLNECLRLEKRLYRKIGYKGKLHASIIQSEVGRIFSFITALRNDEYYSNVSCKSPFFGLMKIYWRRKHNRLGIELGIRIPINTFGKGLLIYHSQSIIIHQDVRCGEFCELHGMNCIGNNGSENSLVPRIGSHFNLGVGAVVIGDISIADNVTVAANAVLCKSIDECNVIVAGIPASVMRKK